MYKRIIAYYWEFRYKILKLKWDRSKTNSVVNGLALMYHHISDEHVDINESCQHSIKVFRDTLVSLQRNGYKFVSVDDALRIIKTKDSTKFALVTFDDVPSNVYYNAYPILQELGIPFVLFMTTDFLDKEGFLSSDQLKELDECKLCTIGAHTCSHPMLRKVSNSIQELVNSKVKLESILGHQIDYMAYPFGRQSSVSNRIIKETAAAGYKCAFGTIQSPITDLSSLNLFYLPRVVIK